MSISEPSTSFFFYGTFLSCLWIKAPLCSHTMAPLVRVDGGKRHLEFFSLCGNYRKGKCNGEPIKYAV